MKKALCVCLSVLVLLSCLAGARAEEDALRPFRELLVSFMPSEAKGYYIADITMDGTPELMIETVKNGRESVLSVYELSGDSAVCRGEMPFSDAEALLFGNGILGVGAVSRKDGRESLYYGYIEDGLFMWGVLYDIECENERYTPYALLQKHPLSELSALSSPEEASRFSVNLLYFENAKVDLYPGKKMPDFSFIDCDGNEHTLSEMLQEYDCVFINFFYIGCVWCERQDPFLQKALEASGGRAAAVAFSPYDSPEEIAAFRDEKGFTFLMAADAADLASRFGIAGFPTSYIVGRDFMISEEISTVLEEGVFEERFERYRAD